MVKIRLRRMGAKKRPVYRVVVADSRSPQKGRFIETIGLYDPLTEPTTIRFKEDRLSYWISVGAQPTEPIAKLMRRAGIENPRAHRNAAGAGNGAQQPAEEAQPAPEESAAAPPAEETATDEMQA